MLAKVLRRVSAAIVVLALAALATPTTASSQPPLNALGNLCAAQDASFFGYPPDQAYAVCESPRTGPHANRFTEAQLTAAGLGACAQRACTRRASGRSSGEMRARSWAKSSSPAAP